MASGRSDLRCTVHTGIHAHTLGEVMARPGKHEKPIGWMGLGEGAMTPIYESDYDEEEKQPTLEEEAALRAAAAETARVRAEERRARREQQRDQLEQ